MAGVSEWVIGVTIVAAGTSLPELITCLTASLKGRNEMLLGNLVGSDFFNFAGVLGLTCIMRPLEVSPSALSSLYTLVGMVLVVLVFMRTGWRVSRLEGLMLLGLNLLRWGVDFTGV
jgi:cation:H+ antiporter